MAVFVPGLRLSDRYVLARRIGSGGMSQVWLAEDERLGRPVAIKGIDHALVGDLAALNAIRREARAAASVSHPHVAQIYDYGEAEIPSGGSVPYLVMELLDGPDLSQRLAGDRMAWPEAVRMAAEVAWALAAAHGAGVIHGDIKPGNIVLTASGARVVDFGLAAVRRGGPGGFVDDDTDSVRGGTPAFVAPEILANDEATPAADVYGLGAVLFAALTGAPPIAVTSWAHACQAHAEGQQPVSLVVDGLPPAVADLCTRCLAAAPPSRPTAAEIANELSAVVRQRPYAAAQRAATVANEIGPAQRPLTEATVRSAPPALREEPWRVPMAVAASALIVAGLLLVAVAAFGGPRGQPGRVPLTTAVAPAAPVDPAPADPTPADAQVDAVPDALPPMVAAQPPTTAPVAALPADAAARHEIAATHAAGIIDRRTADKLAHELDKLVAGEKSLLGRVDNIRRGLARSLARSDVPQALVDRLDSLLRQVVGGFAVERPTS